MGNRGPVFVEQPGARPDPGAAGGARDTSIRPVLLGLTMQLPSHQRAGASATDGLYILLRV
ncbi:hypothetical protein EYF80_045916 [Liparis tanakae]|uniref:Uncharacterized protein n=1 Tax=Liparis tanakae TaxID=230148 RepID=A0A4Z2FT51_9TELE|nr:hypothetical protein EYF80_045916 [Liparis tanakae]